MHQLAAVVPAAGNARHYAKIVKDEATLRRLLGVAHSDRGRASPTASARRTRWSRTPSGMLFDVAHGESTGDFRSVDEILDEEIDKLEQLSRDGHGDHRHARPASATSTTSPAAFRSRT